MKGMLLTLPCCFNLENVSGNPTMRTVERVAVGALNLKGLILGSVNGHPRRQVYSEGKTFSLEWRLYLRNYLWVQEGFRFLSWVWSNPNFHFEFLTIAYFHDNPAPVPAFRDRGACSSNRGATSSIMFLSRDRGLYSFHDDLSGKRQKYS